MLRWFEEGGNNSDVVISSRVRLARNINGYNFSYKMSDTDAKKLVKNVLISEAAFIHYLRNR